MSVEFESILEESLSSLSLNESDRSDSFVSHGIGQCRVEDDHYLDDYPTLQSVLYPSDLADRDRRPGQTRPAISLCSPRADELEKRESPVSEKESKFSHEKTQLMPIRADILSSTSAPSTVFPPFLSSFPTKAKLATTYSSSGANSSKVGIQFSSTFNKKLYLPKVHELPTNSGDRAQSIFQNHKQEMIKSLHNLHSSLMNCPSDETSTSQPLGLTINLFEHQSKGLSWLLWRESEAPSGGILADDMGLGKTIQMIALILKAKQMAGKGENVPVRLPTIDAHGSSRIRGGTLIVVPTSVLGQWRSEVRNRVKCNYLTVYVYHGNSRLKSIHTLAFYNLVLTTYGIVQKASELDPLKRIMWDRIILDEAHLIRNHRSRTAQSVFALKGHRKWALTGTPIQNKCQDYFALMKFLQVRPFNDLAVWKKFVDNQHESGLERLRVINKVMMLRRTKEQVKNTQALSGIGRKHLENVFIELDEEEFTLYEKLSHFSKALLAQLIQEQSRRGNGNITKWDGHGQPPKEILEVLPSDFTERNPDIARWLNNFMTYGEVRTLHILVLLLRLRQLCCHPSLTRATLSQDDFETGSVHETSEGSDFTSNDELFGRNAPFFNNSPLFEEGRMSSKVRAMLDLLRRIFDRSKHDKVIIVSQWTSFLALIETFIEKHLGEKCTLLNGKVPVARRQLIVDKFNSASLVHRILLLSLTAGGIGLNLTGANHIIFADLHWNPQWEIQAADRIYRIGQKKNVFVHKILSKCTIEERILRLQQSKISIAKGILNGFDKSGMDNRLSVNDLKLLFGIEDVR